MLQWLVTDHREADDAAGTGGGSGLAALLSAQRQPQDVLCAHLRAGRGWPYTPNHGLSGANFALANAQLFKGLAQQLPPERLLGALLPPLLELGATAGKRDVQATAAEAVAGLVRGAGVWPLPLQQQLWRALGAPLASALRACSVEGLGDWQSCLRFMCFNRDPRRIGYKGTLALLSPPSHLSTFHPLATLTPFPLPPRSRPPFTSPTPPPTPPTLSAG